jgi:hypothetical protein
MKKYSFLLFLILALFGFLVFTLFRAARKTDTITGVTPHTENSKSQPTVPVLSVKCPSTYKNTKYQYEIVCPDGLEINGLDASQSLDSSSSISITKKGELYIAESGVHINVVPDSTFASIRELCQNISGSIWDQSIFCGDGIETDVLKIGSVTWEHIKNKGVGLVPSSYIILSAFHNRNLYFIDSKEDVGQITNLMQTFSFTVEN